MFKRNKFITILSTLILLFAILIISAWVINRYVYDLMHKTELWGCSGKGVIISNWVQNQQGEDFLELLDISKLANEIKKNTDYEVFYKHPNYLLIKRRLNNVDYEISFNNSETKKTTFFKVDSRNEACTEPDYSIEQRVFKIIDELPLSEKEKKILKASISVGVFPSVQMGWSQKSPLGENK